MTESNENNGNAPQLKTPEELRRERLQPYWLDPRIDYPTPYSMLEYNGVPFSPLGGVQAISGQKKNGKTFVLTQLMAAMLAIGDDGEQIGHVDEFLPGMKVPTRTLEHIGRPPRVLFVDTEMEKLNSAKVLRRVHWLCGWPMNEAQERFNVLWLRSVKADINTGKQAFQVRRDLILSAVDEVQPDVVFIDGIRDIIGSFNDETESAALVGELMALAEDRQMCIWNALHMNPRPRNDDESKMRGHLGTELGNKVTDTLVSIKKKEAGGQVTFTVQQQDARDKDMEDWQFVVCDAAGALGIPKIINNGNLARTIERIEAEKETMDFETLRVLKTIIMPPQSDYFTNIIKKLKDGLHVGETKAKAYWNDLREKHPNLIYQRDGGKFTLSKKEVEAFESGLPWAPETPTP